MARFEQQDQGGGQILEIRLEGESIEAEATMVCRATGRLTISVPWFTRLQQILQGTVSDEVLRRSVYAGTGTVSLQIRDGHFHVLGMQDESWILEREVYAASEIGVHVGCHRESLRTSLPAGEGLLWLQTRVWGRGKVVLATAGPVERIEIRPGEQFVEEGASIVGRTAGVTMRAADASRHFQGRGSDNDKSLRVFAGTGAVLIDSRSGM